MRGYRTIECPKYFWTRVWTVTSFISCDLEAFWQETWLFCIMSVMKTGQGFDLEMWKVFEGHLRLESHKLFFFCLITQCGQSVNMPKDNVVNRDSRRQTMILCVRVDFDACCVSVHLQRVSRRGKIRRVCELLSPGGAEQTANLCEVYVVDRSRHKKKKKKKRNYLIQGNSNL